MLHKLFFSHFQRALFSFFLPSVFILTLVLLQFSTNACSAEDMIWVEDSLPAGAIGHTIKDGAWKWINGSPTPYSGTFGSPTPYSGTFAHQSALKTGLHQHYFTGSTDTLKINAGDTMIAYVYLDPANMPSTVMLQWYDGRWNHRAYWGADTIKIGKNGTQSKRYIGALPPAGEWVRLEVPASDVGLEGEIVNGMAFTLYDGRATWDRAGKSVLGSSPVLDVITNVTVYEGETVTFSPTATDLDGDTLTFSYSGWMTSNSYTTNYTDAGTYTVTVTVSDGILTDTQDVNITVLNSNQAPVLDQISNITVNEGEAVTFSPTATDLDADTLTFSYSGWMTSNSYTTNYTDAGTYTVTVTVSDDTMADSQDVTVTVNNNNQAPVLSTISPVTVNEGDAVTFSPTATDPDGDTLTFSYSGWMTSNSYTTNYTDAGTHTVTVIVSDGMLTDTQDVNITVLNSNQAPVLDQIINITVNEGEAVTFSPTATDQDGDTLTFSYSGWMTSNSYTTNYTDAGTHTVTVTVTDGILTESQDVTITVNNINQAPVLSTISPVTVNEGETITLSPTASDLDGDTLTFSYSGWMISNSYTTNYTDAGTHTVTVTVSDGTMVDSQDFIVTVNNNNQAPVLSTISPVTVNEGETITLSPTASDLDGDALTFSYSGWMTSNSYTTNYTDAGIYTVTVTVSDGTMTDSQDVTVTVNNINQAPVLSTISPVTVNEGETITLSPTASDLDGDTLTFSYSG